MEVINRLNLVALKQNYVPQVSLVLFHCISASETVCWLFFIWPHQHVGWPARLGGNASTTSITRHWQMWIFLLKIICGGWWVVDGCWLKGFCTRKAAKWLCKLLATIVLQIGQFIALLLLRVSSAAWLQFLYIYPFCNSLFHYVACRNALVVADNCKFNHHIKFQVRPGYSLINK